MDWGSIAAVALLINLASSQIIRQPCGYPCSQPTAIRQSCGYPCSQPTAIKQTCGYPCSQPTAIRKTCGYPCSQPTIVDNGVVQSLIDTIQLMVVSDLLEETLPEKQKIVVPSPTYVYDYDDNCDVFPYEYVFDKDCPDFVTALVPRPPKVPKPKCVTIELNDEYIFDNDCPGFVTAMIPRAPKRCVNFGLNEELILPPLAPELPCGLGYLPGALPVVAKAYAPSSKFCACGCGSTPCTAAALPICSPYSCAALAAPLNPDASPFYKPVIL